MSETRVLYVVGAESAGKTDLVRQLQALSVGKLRAQVEQVAPTIGQEIVRIDAPPSAGGAKSLGEGAAVEVRELGGSVSTSWVSFIQARLEKDADTGATEHFALMFVVDATGTHMVPAAATALQQLKESPGGVCRAWPTLVVLQKCEMKHTMTKEEAWALLTGGEPETEGMRIVEVDTWTGKGLRAVMEWVFQARCTR